MASIPKKFRRVFPNNEKYISVKVLGKFRLNNFLNHPQTKRDVEFLSKVLGDEEDFDLFKEVLNYCVPDSIRKKDLEEAIDCLGEEKVRKAISLFKEADEKL